MASGIIIGKCKLCNELIWEDEEFIIDEEVHSICKDKSEQLEIDFTDKRLLLILKKYIDELLERSEY